MTRKHFEAIARALRDARPTGGLSIELRAIQREQWERDVNAIARALAPFNSGFDAVRFLRACNGEG